MGNDQLEVYKAHRAAQDKYVYFLLAAAGAAIGLVVTQTRDATLAWSQAPLGLAVFCWGLSFFFGCQHLRYLSAIMYANAALLRVQNGEEPKVGTHPDHIAAACAGIRSVIETNNDRANRYGHWQFRLLVGGGILYVVWHVLAMYLRSVSG